MANKPFSIQESKLRIAGVDLEAGNTTIVIPGVTQATNYKVEEVEDTGDQTYQFAPNSGPVVIDAALYATIIAQGNESGWADFTVTTDDDGYIDEIEVNGQGTYSQSNAGIASSNDMYAYVGAGSASDRPLVPQDWVQIPFRPMMRAGDIQNIGGGGSIVERSIEFPNGESGDTRGTIALTPNGETYICTEDWQDAATGLQGTFSATTAELYNISQSGNVFNSAVLSIADEPEIYNILRYGSWSEGQFTIDAGVAYGGAQNVTSTGYNDQTGLMSILWLHRAEDPEELAQGSSVTIAYTGGGTQTPIWKRLVDLVSGGEGSGLGKINWRSEGDLTIETLRPQGYTGDCDLNLYAADDVFITANGDEVDITANTNVVIESDDGNHAWTFAQDGSLKLPGHSNTGYEPFYGLDGPTLRLGGENDPNDQIIITGPIPNQSNPNAQRIVIQGQKGFGGNSQAGEGGDVYIWGGLGGEYTDGSIAGGDGGDIKLRGGAGQNGGAGGYIRIEAGDSFYGPGGAGGFVEINAGDRVQVGNDGNGDGGDISIQAGRGMGTGNNGEIFLRTGQNREFQWQFDNGGVLHLPTGGDIVDSNGSSVLGGGGGGEPTISNTVKGFINLVGDRPNQDSTIGFSTVAVWGDYAYVLGSDFYFTSSTDKTKVYKFDLRTGEQVWVKQIRSSRGAEFNLTVGGGTVTIDLIADSGTGYKVGEEIVIRGDQIGGAFMTNDVTIIVDTVDGSGGVNTASIKPGYDVTGLTGTYTNIAIQNDDIVGDTCAIAYSPIINKVLAVSEYYTNYGDNQDTNWTWANLYVIDPATGVIDSSVTLSDEGDIFPISMDVTSVSGDVAIAGEKYNEYRELGELTLLAGYNGYFDILKSNLDPEHYPGDPYSSYGDFWITGTGITNQENVDNVNEYANVATTVRQGSGATFSVTVAIPGDPYATASQFAFGTNYRVGHKVKLSGADLGGTTPENDVTITVTSVDGDGGITGVSFEGTSNVGALPGTIYNGISGTNYNVGSGYTAFIYVDATTGAYNYGGSNNPGSNYVAGDVITITGTTFANGATPANDATIIVGTVDGSGAVNSIQGGTVSGTGPTNALRIRVDGVDFTAPGGEWMMRQNLGGEAFVWTANWSNAIGGASGDRFYDVSWNSDATAIYAVGVGRYEVNYDQALVVKFNAVTGAVIWSKDIKFSEATTENRQARAVCMIPNSSDIMVAGAWYNNTSGQDELILTRISSEGVAVWQKTYLMTEDEAAYGIDYEISLKALDSTNVLVSFEQSTNNSQGLAYLQVNATTGVVVRHRVLHAPGNGNFNAHDTSTPTFADLYTDGGDDYIVMAGRTYVPTDDSRNALLIKLPLDGLKNIEIGERLSLGEHILTRHDVTVTTVTPAFDSFTPDEHLSTVTSDENLRNYSTIAPDGELGVWTFTVTDDTAGFLEFGDGSKQSFATNVIPQIPAANDYYITDQDSGKHLFFEHENGTVYIPHWQTRNLPVGFTFTIVNTSTNDVWVETMTGPTNRGRLKLAGRNIDTYTIGIPDSGSGSMVTLLKVKQGYYMPNSDGNVDYPDVWMVSGPGDIYDND